MDKNRNNQRQDIIEGSILDEIRRIEKTFRSGKPRKEDVRKLARCLDKVNGKVFRGVEVYTENDGTKYLFSYPKAKEDDIIATAKVKNQNKNSYAKVGLMEINRVSSEAAAELVSAIRSALEVETYLEEKEKAERETSERILEEIDAENE